jgi:hypothetical protein
MKRLVASLIVLAGSAAVACYQDDTLQPASIAPTKVFLTDDPFPFDTVGSVNIYVSRIEASTGLDTTGDMVTIATPNQVFDLLTLQQGAKAFVGQGTIDAGHYHLIRMTIDVDRSSIKYSDGTNALIHWPYPGSGEIPLYAQVEEGVAVSQTGTDIVLVLDVGRSFLYNLSGDSDFVMFPSLRAVNSAATGAITGKVVVANAPVGSDVLFLHNTNVTIFSGDPGQPPTKWNVIATARTDTNGVFVASYLPAGNWNMKFEQVDDPALIPRILFDVPVTPGDTTHQGIALGYPTTGSSVRISAGGNTVGVGGPLFLYAVVLDSTGLVLHPQVTWSSQDTSIAAVYADSTPIGDTTSTAVVVGRSEGTTWIRAVSGPHADSIAIQVVSVTPPVPVASVTITPPSLTVAVGDTGNLTAVLRDSVGNVLANRQVSWFFTDSTGAATLFYAVGEKAGIQGVHSGTSHIRAASENKFKDATITVP